MSSSSSHKIRDFLKYNKDVPTRQLSAIINDNIRKCKQNNILSMVLSGYRNTKIFIFANGMYFVFEYISKSKRFDAMLSSARRFLTQVLKRNVDEFLNLEFNFHTKEQEEKLKLYEYYMIAEEEVNYYYKGLVFDRLKLNHFADIIENSSAKANDIDPVSITIFAEVNEANAADGAGEVNKMSEMSVANEKNEASEGSEIKCYPLLIRLKKETQIQDVPHLISLIYLSLLAEREFEEGYSNKLNKEYLLDLELEYEKEGIQKLRYQMFYHEKIHSTRMKRLHYQTSLQYYNFR